MKKISLLFLLSLPFVGFSNFDYNGVEFVNWVNFKYTSFGSTTKRNSGAPFYNFSSLESFRSALMSGEFSFCVNSNKDATSTFFSIAAPVSIQPLPLNGFDLGLGTVNVSVSRTSITNSVFCRTNGVGCVVSPLYFPEISAIYWSAANLFFNGYRGIGFKDVFTSGKYSCINVDYPLLLADIFSSTNTLYRSILLSHLNSIQSSVQNIELNVSGLQSSVDRLYDINSSSLSNLESVAGISGSILSNLIFVADSSRLSSPDELRSALVSMRDSAVMNVNGFSLALDRAIFDLDPSNYDLSEEGFRAFYDFVVRSYQRGFSSLQDLIGLSSLVGDVDPRYNGLSKIGDLFVSSVVEKVNDVHNSVESVVDALIGDYPTVTNNTRGAKSVDVRTSIKSQLQSWREEARRQLQDWKADLKQDLQDWKHSDERGILNVRDDIRSNFSYRDPRSGTNDLPFTSFVTNFVTHVITNVIRQSSNDISSNVVDQAERTRKLFDDKLFDPNSDGVNVRIKWPLRYESTSEVNVHDQALDDILGNLHSYTTTMSNLVEGALLEFKNNLTATNSVDWEPWFEKWGEYADIVTNFYAQFNGSGPVADLADRFLSEGFDSSAYGELPWFSRVEVLLAMIAGVSTNSVDVADISEELHGLVDEFEGLGTNVVSSSESFVGLFDYVRRTAGRFKSVFGDRSAPVTDGGIVLLSAGSWIGNEPLVLKVNSTVQNVLRLFFRCFWLLSALVVVWLVVSWSWQKVVSILRWLWSMFEL